MEDLQKIKEFFSKPLEEDSMSKFAYYSNNELNFYAREKTQQRADYALKCPDPKIVDKLDKEIEAITHELKKRSQKIKEFFSKPLPEEAKEDPTDIIAMDVPLFLRMLEWAKEEAAEDIDLHEVTERAIEAVKLRGLLSMDDYQDLIGEPIEEETGYSKYLTTPENPKGKTPGLTPDVLNKILMKIANVDDIDETIRLGENMVYEELCPKGKAYIKRRKAAGEKSSAYLSGRAVKVCKGQMSGTKRKKKKVNEESDARKSAIQSFQKMPIGKVVKTTKGDFKKIEADKFENISTKVKYNSAQMSYTTPLTK